MKLDSKYFDKIRVKPSTDKKKSAETIPQCDWPDCPRPGRHKAPMGRGHEGKFYNYCTEHVQEYNKSYNYFQGMKDDEILTPVLGDGKYAASLPVFAHSLLSFASSIAGGSSIASPLAIGTGEAQASSDSAVTPSARAPGARTSHRLEHFQPVLQHFGVAIAHLDGEVAEARALEFAQAFDRAANTLLSGVVGGA